MTETGIPPRGNARRKSPRWWLVLALLVLFCALWAGGYYVWLSSTRGELPWGRKGKTNENQAMSYMQTGTPNRLVRDDGAYQLVAIIDGAGANKQFISNLQVINVQRQALGELRSKIASLPKSAAASEKAGLENQAKEIETRLTTNMEFMTKNYGYSVNFNYILIPLQANLLEKAKDEEGKFIEDESKATLVRTLGSTEEYESFEGLRQRHAQAVQKKEQGEATDKEVKALAKELNERFSFKAGGNYALQITKGALYAKVQ